MQVQTKMISVDGTDHVVPVQWFAKSATLWVNILMLGAGWLLDHQGVLQSAGVDAQTQVIIITIVNMILRFKTNRPLST